MQFTRSGGHTALGPEAWFTDTVFVDSTGDVVSNEPDDEHWHGATAERFMAHVPIQEADENGQVVTWLEHVRDEEYAGPRM